jgi:pimeloyl-ACP methyl ester carboxylesterase
VVINAPHPAAFLRALRTTSQALRSWYVFAFQVPFLPELLLQRSNMKALRRIWSRASRRSGNVTPADVDKYAKAFSKPGKISAAVNYYRAALRSMLRPKRGARVAAPTLLIWGGRDKFLVPQLPAMTKRWVKGLETRNLADFGHWPQLESPETVNAAIVEFLAHD